MSELKTKQWAEGKFDYVLTDEFRETMSEVHKANWERGVFDNRATEEWRKNQSDTKKAQWESGEHFGEEFRQKVSENTKASWARGDFDGRATEEYRQNVSEAVKAAWARGDFDGVFVNPSSLEIAFAAALEICNVGYISQHRLDGDSRPYDFFIPPRLLVEIDGEYWHKRPGAAEKDRAKTELAKVRGFILRRVPERAFKEQSPLDIVQERILPIIDEINSLLEPSSR